MSDTITVTSAGDSGSGTLRQAISDAQVGDTIEFHPSISTITLSSVQITIDKSLNIQGPIVLTTSNTANFRVFEIQSGVEVTIDGISVTDVDTTDISGGAIYNSGTLTILNSNFTENSVVGTDTDGGAIYNNGSLIIIGSKFIFNSAGGDAGDGGAIYNTDSGRLVIINSAFSANSTTCATTGGANGCNGGAINNWGILTITGSTLDNNDSYYGGGIYNAGILTITNSTISNNASFAGSAIYNTGSVLNIIFSTIAENRAWGDAVIYNSSLVIFKNSIVANNSLSNYSGPGSLTAFGQNFSTDSSMAYPQFTQVTPEALKLGKLALNLPGVTETHALLQGSVAIDTVTDGTDLDGNPVTIDQRGVLRPQNNTCDAGAYEYVEDPIRGILLFGR